MKETILSNNERVFVEKSIEEVLRIDKRQLTEFRNLGIFFGKKYGSVLVSLGDTRVFANVSCEVNIPKTTRPNEGTVFINVEMSNEKMSESCIVTTRILERTIRDSRCIDLESLCIIAEEKVWNLRVDVSILNNEGNVTDCACIAAVSALAHFKRPDCTTSGDGEFIIHKSSEKDLIPTVLHHYPICMTYALFKGKIPIADPTLLEERVTNAGLTLGINSYKEICSLHMTGVSLTSPFLIQKCSEMAAERAKHVVEFIKSTLEQDSIDREKSNVKGFKQSIILTNVTSNFCDEQSIDNNAEEISEVASNHDEIIVVSQEQKFKKIDENTISTTKWKDENEETSSSDSEIITLSQSNQEKSKVESMQIDSSDDEEKETIILN
ncbi:hypothetical protein PVAND_003609 [Polypedilum vanderplanki]|uniref:Exosome complex component RRP45 n=1 Tax=Polypedilum vanderplanki TaxID=319348 RepID=A0A9J6BVK9_POLVA|nr:hypothetical protein PVAND_003609 [Polypedilum vanderplanki]